MAVGLIHRDITSNEFFDGTAKRHLLIRECDDCGHACVPAAQSCSACASPTLSWVEASGDGILESWIVVHERARDKGAEPTRTPVGLVELTEGPWIEAQLVDVDPDSLFHGQRFTVDFEAAEGGEALPVFRPAQQQ